MTKGELDQPLSGSSPQAIASNSFSRIDSSVESIRPTILGVDGYMLHPTSTGISGGPLRPRDQSAFPALLMRAVTVHGIAPSFIQLLSLSYLPPYLWWLECSSRRSGTGFTLPLVVHKALL